MEESGAKILRELRELRRVADLEASESEILAVLKGIPGPRIMYLGADMRIRWCSASVERVARVRGGVLSGRRCYRAIHGRTTPCAGCPVLSTLETRQPHQSDMDWKGLEALTLHSDPILGPDRRLEGILVTAFETQPRSVEAGVPSHTQTTAKTSGHAVNIVCPNFSLMVVAPENADYVGRTTAELLGKKCYREIADREDVCPYCPGVRTLATGKPSQSETEGRRPDGSRFYALIRTEPLIGPDGTIIGFTEVVEDTTDSTLLRQTSSYRERVSEALGQVSLREALKQVLDAALGLDGIEGGAVFMASGQLREIRLIGQRALPIGLASSLRQTARAPKAPLELMTTRNGNSVLVMSIHCGQQLVADLRLLLSVPGFVHPLIQEALADSSIQLAARCAKEATERERDEALRLARTVLDSFPNPVWCVDDRNRVTHWNTAATRVFGWNEDEVLRETPRIAIPDSDEWKNLYSVRQGGRTVHHYALPCLRKDMSIVRVLATVAPPDRTYPANVTGVFVVELVGSVESSPNSRGV